MDIRIGHCDKYDENTTVMMCKFDKYDDNIITVMMTLILMQIPPSSGYASDGSGAGHIMPVS